MSTHSPGPSEAAHAQRAAHPRSLGLFPIIPSGAGVHPRGPTTTGPGRKERGVPGSRPLHPAALPRGERL